MARYSVFLAAWLVTGNAFAQQPKPLTVRGAVVDETSTPIAGVESVWKWTIFGDPGETEFVEETVSFDGRFERSKDGAAEVQVTFRKRGYLPQRLKIKAWSENDEGWVERFSVMEFSRDIVLHREQALPILKQDIVELGGGQQYRYMRLENVKGYKGLKPASITTVPAEMSWPMKMQLPTGAPVLSLDLVSTTALLGRIEHIKGVCVLGQCPVEAHLAVVNGSPGDGFIPVGMYRQRHLATVETFSSGMDEAPAAGYLEQMALPKINGWTDSEVGVDQLLFFFRIDGLFGKGAVSRCEWRDGPTAELVLIYNIDGSRNLKTAKFEVE